MSKKNIVVFGATGHQGSGVVNALLNDSEYMVTAISRSIDTDKAKQLRDRGANILQANLNDPDTLKKALENAYGVFLVTNFWDPSTGNNEYEQVKNAVTASQETGITHFVWSTLPNTQEISDGKYRVPHFTNKALANNLVSNAGFEYFSFVEAPFFFQNLAGNMGAQPMGESDLKGWAIPIDPDIKCIDAGDIFELGKLVLQVFNNPKETGNGDIISLSSNMYSWNDFVKTLNSQGHRLTVNQVPNEIYDTFYPGAPEVREMLNYFQEYTYFGPNSIEKKQRAEKLIAREITSFDEWAKENLPI